MNFRPKTLRRLLILASIAGAFIILMTVVVTLQLGRYKRQHQALRKAGMEAYEQGNYRSAVDILSKYLSNDRIDSPAIFACAVARSKVAQPDKGNLLDARRQFNRYLELNHGDIAARHQLLEIYQKLHYSPQTMGLADELLAEHPDDAPALSAKLQLLVSDQKFSAALPISLRLNELSPGDLRSQETTYFLMSQNGLAASTLVDRAETMLKEHPQVARYEMLRGVAAYFAKDPAAAKQWLKTAAAHPPAEADLTLMLASNLDRLELWDDAMSLLKRAGADTHASSEVRVALVQRLWEFKQYDAALTALKDLDLRPTGADSRLIGLQALMQLKASPNDAEYHKDLAGLQARPDDMAAVAWKELLIIESKTSTAGANLPLQPYLAAEQTDPDNPDIRYYLAEQLDRMGETELSLQCLRQLNQMQPEWAAPYSEISRILLERGEVWDAVAPAEAACRRFPQSFYDHLALENAQYENLDPQAKPEDIQPVLELAQRLRKSRPHDEALLSKEVDLLSRSGQRGQAVELAMSSGSDAEPAQASTLRELSKVDRKDRLGIAEQLAHQAGLIEPKSPDEARAIFDVYVIGGELDQAKLVLAMMRSKTGDAWKVQQLEAQESIGENVAPEWEKLADTLQSQFIVQRAALQSHAVRANRPLMDRTINRIKNIVGEDGIEWKLQRARWLVDSSRDIKNDANTAAELMTDVIRRCPADAQPLIIRGEALVKIGDYNGAIASLQLAQHLEPKDPRIAEKLAALAEERQPAGRHPSSAASK